MQSLQLTATNPDQEVISVLQQTAVRYYFRNCVPMDDFVLNRVENRMGDHLGDYAHDSICIVVSDAGMVVASHTDEGGMRVTPLTPLQGESDADAVRAIAGVAAARSALEPSGCARLINWEEFKFRCRRHLEALGADGVWTYDCDRDGDLRMSLDGDDLILEVTGVQLHTVQYPQVPDHVFYAVRSGAFDADFQRGEGDLTEDTWRDFSRMAAGCLLPTAPQPVT